ncbi:uncharacterized protein LOC102804086 [Saccoglossus kowalevskii]|uniref:Uncharacterized protein LOC102804086 n=1 Tax=Saccoglossus kowalevskii TaxID=10224 RepID=A0ABM0M7C4_SACKO|nr:PREDICTED: uncharacterized protein LOC102804086 [Saccoglossus kowalevskii]
MLLTILVVLAISGLTNSYDPNVCDLCTQHQNNICFDLANAYLYNPENWDVGLGEQWCEFMRIRLECLLEVFCEFAPGGFDIVRNINQLTSTLAYYEEWGICDNTLPGTLLGPCHLAVIRERCVNETVLHIRAKYSISCLETVRLLDCIYQGQLNPECTFPFIFDPRNLAPYVLLNEGNCCYRPVSQELQDAGDAWREAHPGEFCLCEAE